ncbi:two-component sensor histidine kinase [Propioniciclava coleopterorum]|uniref:histidine kinase n=1 Tax=Propioniciclava coleopterorum TaxID=2714937 RepID=A0A6G7Y5S2_9ACTN|nr:histidine kinase [Propioniciclava coleopterorum]QIK71967.1 two-component sensor histidine kinase [Propioniciclava coleopterorum]
MLSYERIDDGAASPWWVTALMLPPVGLAMMTSAVFSPVGGNVQGATPDLGTASLAVLGMLLAVAGPVALFWRHRFPFVLTFAALLVPLVVPIGIALLLVLVASLVGRRRGPAVWATLGVAAASVAAVVTADVLAQPRGASVSKMLLTPTGPDLERVDAPIGAVVAITVVWFAGAVGIGYLLRLRRLTRKQGAEVRGAVETVGRLGDEVARRQERERIAREVHDAMGHRLSLLNLHAGALELNAGEDPRVQESAGLVRKSAGEAMDDLRSLLQVLRDPLGEDTPEIPLSRLREVVQESFGAGQVVSSSIFISEAERADPTLSRAVYRIVQEVLTNARKHAPGEPVLLTVEGAPATGVVIDARNRFVGVAEGAGADAGRGLKGIAERAELLGGKLQYGLEDKTTFRVRVVLPWRDAATAR